MLEVIAIMFAFAGLVCMFIAAFGIIAFKPSQADQGEKDNQSKHSAGNSSTKSS